MRSGWWGLAMTLPALQQVPYRSIWRAVERAEEMGRLQARHDEESRFWSSV
jgi:hypothetical protein